MLGKITPNSLWTLHPIYPDSNRFLLIFPYNTFKKAVYCLSAYSPGAKLLSSTTQAEMNFQTLIILLFFTQNKAKYCSFTAIYKNF